MKTLIEVASELALCNHTDRLREVLETLPRSTSNRTRRRIFRAIEKLEDWSRDLATDVKKIHDAQKKTCADSGDLPASVAYEIAKSNYLEAIRKPMGPAGRASVEIYYLKLLTDLQRRMDVEV